MKSPRYRVVVKLVDDEAPLDKSEVYTVSLGVENGNLKHTLEATCRYLLEGAIREFLLKGERGS